MSLHPRPLANPSNLAQTVAWAGVGTSLVAVPMLHSEGPCAEWRLVEFFTDKGVFDIEARWTTGGGGGNWWRATIQTAGRVCLYAQSLQLVCYNRTNVASNIRATVTDLLSPIPTQNVWSDLVVATPAGDGVSTPPAFALAFRVDFLDAAAAAAALIEELDGAGAVITAFAGNKQVQPWNTLGDAFAVKVSGLGAGTRYRVTFLLAM